MKQGLYRAWGTAGAQRAKGGSSGPATLFLFFVLTQVVGKQ